MMHDMWLVVRSARVAIVTLAIIPMLVVVTTSRSFATEAQAVDATVLISGYMDVVAGCNFKSNAADEFVAKDCERQHDSTIIRSFFRCAGVVVDLANSHARSLGILTARHCVLPTRELSVGDTILLFPDETTIRVQFHDGDVGTFVGAALGVLPRDDVALIRVDAKSPHTSVGSPNLTISEGEQLYVLGHSHEYPWGLKHARSVDGVRTTGIDDWEHTSMIECPSCASGDSGAGVWDSHWKLVGIFNAVTAQFGLFTSSQRILSQLSASGHI
jgi:hypothetical protein